jgi:hypothetical protein
MLTYFAGPEERDKFPISGLNGILQGVSVVLNKWAEKASHYGAMPIAEIDPLYFDFTIKFTGRSTGILSVRTTPDLAMILLAASEAVALRNLSQEEIYSEFAAVLSGRLMAHLWITDKDFFISGAPTFSNTGIWADHQTMGSCAFLVKQWPVEVRVLSEKPEADQWGEAGVKAKPKQQKKEA